MNLKEEKQEIYNYIDVLHHNRDMYSSAKLLELVKDKIKETIPNTILSEHNDNIDTSENALPIKRVVGSALLNELLDKQREIISSPIRANCVDIENIKIIFAKHGIYYKSPF